MVAAQQESTQEEVLSNSKVVVKFTTKLPDEYKIPEDEIEVDGDLQRLGLSKMLNDFLMDGDEAEADKERAVTPFDFIIRASDNVDESETKVEEHEKTMRDTYLRSSLSSFLQQQEWSTEKVLVIEYVLAMPEPDSTEIDKQDDWVLHVCGVTGTEFYAASGDGSVTLYREGKKVCAVQDSRRPVSCMAAQNSAHRLLLVGSKDRVLRFYVDEQLAATKEMSSTPTAAWISHDGLMAVVGDHEGRLAVLALEEPSKNRSVGEIRVKSVSRDQHSGAVTSLTGRASQLFSSSLDSSVGMWNMETGDLVVKMPTGKACTSVAARESLVATSHEDGRVAFWDLRVNELHLREAFRSHSLLTCGVRMHLEDRERVVSCSHDGTVKVFDAKAPRMALQSVRLDGKALCATWLDGSTIVSGCSDGKVRLHKTKGL